MINKSTGSYYTPSILSEFLVRHIFDNYNINNLRVLEPSCGDGSFINALVSNSLNTVMSIDVCDIDKLELEECHRIIINNPNINSSKYNVDYLLKDENEYSLIIGNPPYIAKKFLSKDQIASCKKILNESVEVKGEVKNIWPAFLVKATNELCESGVLCFVLPAELLQVKHTKPLRDFILKNYSRIEIFAFDELIFEGAEQDVVVLLGKKEVNAQNNEVSFYQVEKLEDLKIPDYLKKHTNLNRKKLDKWTNYILTEDELNFVEELVEGLNIKRIQDYCKKAEVGIVTAANDYFIRSKDEVKKLKLDSIAEPILKKSSYLKNSIIIDDAKLNIINEENKPSQLLLFENKGFRYQRKAFRDYIQHGVELELNKRYKMKLRDNWFVVPVTWASEGLFVKRCHVYPKLLFNPSKVLATDSFYRVVMKEDYSIEKLTFSFYNTLTFIVAELEGRFYGGGVLELTPSEFKNLNVPYNSDISQNELYKLNDLFNKGTNIEEILDYTDSINLPTLNGEDIVRLREIWFKLLKRRLKR